MRRLAVGAAVAALVAGVAVSSAHAALFFLFKPTTADAGTVVTVRLGGTPASFEPENAERPLRNGIRLYLVRRDVAGEVSSRFDPRLHFVGRIVPDKNSRGVLSFTVPPLDTGAYAVAAWCPECARHSFGRTFFVQTVPRVSRYRRWMGLQVRLPPAAEACPATIPNGWKPRLAPTDPMWHGNGILWSLVPADGTLPARTHKLLWYTTAVEGELRMRVERLDAVATTIVPQVVSGSFSSWQTRGRSWASRTPLTEGCWRITTRVRDISLSYVVKVVASP